MSYINLGAALFTAAIALHDFGSVVRAGFTKAEYQSHWELTVDAIGFGLFGALSVWNFNLAVAS